ncbi:metal ABC transporter permease [Cohnella cholangitidis]|uniref:Metal ABC transporter permease n=1 Tax=Cohnella cholangitidis TaxID=2598458 RepID=A0A7G5C6A5_9BACL|nr:metal ABC transporter permease [Cohnella cholangitidis]QMV44739.1 metal ABC transporter permease [Cohnella cholangitidis]
MEMLHYDFMQRAFFAGGLIALVASVLGVYLMLRRQALMADMLSHVSLAGVSAGALLKFNPSLFGFIIALIGAVVVESVRRSYKTYSEVSIAIIMIGGLSTAVVLMSMNPGISRGFSSYLFGSVVAVQKTEIYLIAAVAFVGAIFFYGLRKPLYLITFDEETAKTNGVPVNFISLLFSIITGMIVAAAMPIVGVLLVSSLIVLPAALAIRLAPGFAAALWLAMLIGLTGVFSGLTASYAFSTPPGGTIALTLLLFLIVGISVKKAVVHGRKQRSKMEGTDGIDEQGKDREQARLSQETPVVH